MDYQDKLNEHLQAIVGKQLDALNMACEMMMFSFEKYSRSGGKAMDFYAHTVLWLATAKKIEKKENAVGVVVKAKTTKSKTNRQTTSQSNHQGCGKFPNPDP